MNLALFLTMTILASPAEAGGPAHAEASPAPAVVPGNAPNNAPNNAPKTDGEQTVGCPTREAVAAALSPALAHIRPNLDPLPSDFRLADLGDAFEVTVGGQVQRYADAARDCAERARVAAVFVALAMNPPSLEPPRPPPPVPPPALQQPLPPPAREPERSWLSVGVAARLDGAMGGGSDATGGATAGGELDVAVGKGSFGIEASAGLMTSTQNTLASVQVTQQRFPCSLSAVGRRRAGAHLELGAALGAALTPFTLHGQGLDTTLPVTRLDAGARFAIDLRVARPGLAPFATLQVEYFPRTYEIAVAPLGNIGTTAPLQLGLSVGVAFEAR
jgi:hypothetical protein